MLKLIIVEDDVFTARQVKEALDWESLGIEVDGLFKNGAEALEHIRSEHVDIVITDIKMPVMDGLTLIKETREISSDITFIIITAHRDFDYARQAISYGVLDYLVKPLQYGTLMEVLNKAVKAAKNNMTVDTVPFQSNQLFSLRQKLFVDILCGANTNIPEISSDLSKARIPKEILNNACALINIDFINFDDFLATKWKHSVSMFKNAIIKTIPFETSGLYFTIVSFLFDQLLIFVSSKTENMDMDAHIYECMAQIQKNMKAILSLDIKYNIISEFANIEDLFHNVEQQKNASDDVISRVKAYISENLSRQIALTDVAAFVHLNPVYFSSYFKNKTGTNFSAYLKKQRLECARKLLDENKVSVSRICEIAGFKSESYFYKLFKSETGLTPQQYRKQILER